jgi:hypothetical protein
MGPAFLLACAVCATADPSLDAPGAEHPFAGRLRSTLDFRVGGVCAGSGAAGGETVGVVDRRLELATSWAPSRTTLLTVSVPALDRSITSPGGRVDALVPGDVEARAQVLAWTNEPAVVRRRLVVFGGFKLPTAPVESDASGQVLPSVLQPGCSAIVPLLGVSWTTSRPPWSAFASVAVLLPAPVRPAPHAGDSLRASFAGQWQPLSFLGARAGVQARADGAGELADGTTDPNSGGLVGYATLEAIASPARDLVLSAGVLVPALQAWRGDHHEGPVAVASAAYDF